MRGTSAEAEGTGVRGRLQVPADDFEARARALKVYDVEAFYSSDLFQRNHMELQTAQRPGTTRVVRLIVRNYM
jgi:hypothetical protein